MANRLPDVSTIIQAGINPKTGLPYKLGDKLDALQPEIRKVIRVMDEQNAVKRYKWFNLPDGLDADNLLERILYYKGQGMFFYMKETNTFFFLPYALDGTIDVYGRYNGVTPLPFGSGTTKTADGKEKPWITGLIKKPIYDIPLVETPEELIKIMEDGCVILRDYTQQISQNIIPRQILNDPICNAMSEAFPFARTNLIANSGVKAVRVPEEDAKAEVMIANQQVEDAAKSGQYLLPIVGPLEFQDLTTGSATKSEEYLLYMQALDNFRLSTYGIDNGGLFEKKAQKLQTEQSMNSLNDGLVYEDGLYLRQHFCDIVNSIWGLGIWCDVPECLINMDQDGDGDAVDNTQDMGQDQSAVEMDNSTAEG